MNKPGEVAHPQTHSKRNRSKAQAAVEFALILPVALMLVFTIIELARIFQAWLVVTNSARVGLRYAVTGSYETEHCTLDIDFNGNGLVCELEPDKDARKAEIDAARLLSIYELTENSAIGIMKDLTIVDKTVPGYFNVTICSTNDGRIYHPPPDDYCDPDDHPGDPSTGPARVLVAVTFEHPVIIPLLSTITPSVTLHAERTGIVEQFRVARVLGLPPVIDVPTVTYPPTSTSSPTVSPTVTPIPDCTLYTMSDFDIRQYNSTWVQINNNSGQDVNVIYFALDWSSAEAWATILGYNNIFVDWFSWHGSSFYDGDDPDSPTEQGANVNLGAGSWGSWETDFNWSGEADWAFIDEFGLSEENFGFMVQLDNDCVINRPAVELPLPEPDCDLYSMSDFWITRYNRLRSNITNGDILDTQIDRIVLDWDHAEALSDVIIGSNNLYVDWFQWDYSYIWSTGSDSIGDLSSTTDTNIDSPGVWYGPDDFDAGDTVRFEADFDFALTSEYNYALLNWGLIPNDFGITFYFTNGCILEVPAIPRPIETPVPNCDLIFADRVRLDGDDFEIRVRNFNASSAYLIDSVLTWPAPPNNNSGQPYVNYLQFGPTRYFNTDTWHSPLQVAPSPSIELPTGRRYTWEADFNNGLPYGEYCGLLTLEYPGWGLCYIDECIEIIEPTGTPTTDPNATPTPTRTLRPTTTHTPAPSETVPPTITRTPTQTWTPPSGLPTRTPTPPPTSESGTPTNTPWPTLPGGG